MLIKCYSIAEDSATLYARELNNKELVKMGIDATKCEELLSEATISTLLSNNAYALLPRIHFSIKYIHNDVANAI